MRKANGIRIDATKVKGTGDFPNYIYLGHRHLQKEMPTSIPGEQTGVKEFILPREQTGVKEFILPLDLLRMTVSPGLLTDIEEVRLAYKKG